MERSPAEKSTAKTAKTARTAPERRRLAGALESGLVAGILVALRRESCRIGADALS